jgi:hypothetical protein
MVEVGGTLSGKLQVLTLIVTDWHMGGPMDGEQNVH